MSIDTKAAALRPSLDARETLMPNPTPYSRQFDAIRSTYPALFEHPRDEARALTIAGGAETAGRRSECADKPDGK